MASADCSQVPTGRSASQTREEGQRRLGHPRAVQNFPLALMPSGLWMAIRSLERASRLSEKWPRDRQAGAPSPPAPSRREPRTREARCSLPLRSINASLPPPPVSLSPGLLRFLSLFHKQNENPIQHLNVRREMAGREQTHTRWRARRAPPRPAEGQPAAVSHTSLPNVKGPHASGFRLTSS